MPKEDSITPTTTNGRDGGRGGYYFFAFQFDCMLLALYKCKMKQKMKAHKKTYWCVGGLRNMYTGTN